jgi:hypothetical protein
MRRENNCMMFSLLQNKLEDFNIIEKINYKFPLESPFG